jgi:hypothetical protein
VIGNPEQIIKRFSLANREHAVEHFHL